MFRNGIYRIDYRSPNDDLIASEDALFVVRDGSIIGADRHGGVYAGSQFGTRGALDGVRVQMTAPPGGEMVTGTIAGPDGAVIDIVSKLDPARNFQTATVEVAGNPVEISVAYLGPFPA